MIERVVAIVVTYEPAAEALRRLVDRLADEVGTTVVVDNGSIADVAPMLGPRPAGAVDLLRLDRNLGIAAAQNRGIAAARARGADAVLLFDQDSLPPAGMVERLVAAYRGLEAAGREPAAVGPVPVDARLGPRATQAGEAARRVDHLIASGCLIPLAVLDRVGPLRDDLFIDYVDIEWCLRAARLGLDCYQVPGVEMAHEFGAPLVVLGRAYASHAPLRHYYLFRNSVWLLRQRELPAGWRLRALPRIAARLLFNALFARPHRAQWRMMVSGLHDGFAGRLGPWDRGPR